MSETLTPARRVRSMDELIVPGDYYLGDGEPGSRSLWFLLPTAESADAFAEPRNPHNGPHRIAEKFPNRNVGWTITEHEDGSVSAQPSIACGLPVYWHGFLEPGNVWRQV